MTAPKRVPTMDATTLLRSLGEAVAQWKRGDTTHSSAMEHVADLLKQHDNWNRRKT